MTGRAAYDLISRRGKSLKLTAAALKSSLEEIPQKTRLIQEELAAARKQLASLKADVALAGFMTSLQNPQMIEDVSLVVVELPGVDKEALGKLADKFREKYPQKGICVIGSITGEGQIIIMAAVTQDLIKRGIKAGDLVGFISSQLGAGGGGAPHLAFGGGREAEKIPEALAGTKEWVGKKLK